MAQSESCRSWMLRVNSIINECQIHGNASVRFDFRQLPRALVASHDLCVVSMKLTIIQGPYSFDRSSAMVDVGLLFGRREDARRFCRRLTCYSRPI